MKNNEVKYKLDCNEDNIICPRCNSNRIKKGGFSKTGIKKYRCKDCGRTFQLEYINQTVDTKYDPSIQVDTFARSVTSRAKEAKQPYGGFLRMNAFDKIVLDDGRALHEQENINPCVSGMVVDYMSRYLIEKNRDSAFKISLIGAMYAEKMGMKNAVRTSENLISKITKLDDTSIINACKLVSFDVWYRNPIAADQCKTYEGINPDSDTIENIKIMIQRSISFFRTYCKNATYGFSFDPPIKDDDAYVDMITSKHGSYGGYTYIVRSGDGDFLTTDTIWEFKTNKTPPTKFHTLQLLMYYIMGKHSGQEIYKNISKIGIFNPRLNIVYTYDMTKISKETIENIEKYIICYDD